ALQERSKRFEAELFGETPTGFGANTGTFWIRQRTDDGQAILNAASSREQGFQLTAVTIFKFDPEGRFIERVEAKSAFLEPRAWRLVDVRAYPVGGSPSEAAAAEM